MFLSLDVFNYNIKMTFLYTVMFILFYSCFGDNNRDLVPREAPNNVTLIEIHGKYLQLEWDPVPPSSVRGTFRGYIVRIWNDVRSQVYAIPPDVTKASIEFFPYSKNFITVSVRNNKFVGPPSQAVNFDAPQAAPNYPFLFEAHQLGANSLLLQWNKPTQPNGVLTGYKIYCTEMNDTYLNEQTAFTQLVTDPNKFQTKLTNMRQDVKYKIGIAATNCAGESLTNYLDVQIYPHTPSVPSLPDFKYRIDYHEVSTDELCFDSQTGDDKEYEEDFYLLNSDKKKSPSPPTQSLDKENSCYVSTRVTWIPDIDKNPGDHFVVKYRMKGAPEYFNMEPDLNKDYVIIKYFNACKNYDIIVTSVDGEFSTDSEKVETPAIIFSS